MVREWDAGNEFRSLQSLAMRWKGDEGSAWLGWMAWGGCTGSEESRLAEAGARDTHLTRMLSHQE